jgi:hypothetical protein
MLGYADGNVDQLDRRCPEPLCLTEKVTVFRLRSERRFDDQILIVRPNNN